MAGEKKLMLKRLPPECYEELLRVQAAEKIKSKKQFSLESAVYQIIKTSIKKDGNKN